MLTQLLASLRTFGTPAPVPTPPDVVPCPRRSYAMAERVFEDLFGRPPRPGDDPVGVVATVFEPLADEYRRARLRERGGAGLDDQRLFETSCGAGR